MLSQVETLITAVNQAVEGDWEQEITVSGDDAVGHLADGLQTLLNDGAETKSRLHSSQGKLSAINSTQAVIEFTSSGEIVDANDNFCRAMGYSLNEIKGQHHRLFVDKEYASSSDYSRFWDDLRRGDAQDGTFTRFKKNGDEIVIRATYTPIVDDSGVVTGVIKLASDVTEETRVAKANELLNCMMEHAPAMIFADTDCIIRYMNPVAKQDA